MYISNVSPIMQALIRPPVQPQIQMAMLKKSNDAIKDEGESALKLIEASMIPVENPGKPLGLNIDTFA